MSDEHWSVKIPVGGGTGTIHLYMAGNVIVSDQAIVILTQHVLALFDEAVDDELPMMGSVHVCADLEHQVELNWTENDGEINSSSVRELVLFLANKALTVVARTELAATIREYRGDIENMERRIRWAEQLLLQDAGDTEGP